MNRADFLNADSDAITFCQADILIFGLSYSLNAGGPVDPVFTGLFVVPFMYYCVPLISTTYFQVGVVKNGHVFLVHETLVSVVRMNL